MRFPRRRNHLLLIAIMGALCAASVLLPASAMAGRTKAPSLSTAPVISGQAVVGSALTSTQGTWYGTTPMTFTYAWSRCLGGVCTAISGATAQTYLIGATDVGSTLRVTVTAKNAAGSRAAASAQTAVVTFVTAPPPPPPTGDATLIFSDSFDAANGSNNLITNEYAFWNPTDSLAVKSSNWNMTSGSLFWNAGRAWSGRPDACAPDRFSTTCTNSAVFRLDSKRSDFANVRVDMDLISHGLTTTSFTPAVAWDGVHIWMRYQSETELYYASVNRRDQTLVIKKKCTGGTSNGGTYYTLASTSTGGAWSVDVLQKVGASIKTNADGSVTINLYRDGVSRLSVVDTGVGCAPITHTGGVGVRGDNNNFEFDNFTVHSL